MPQEQMPEHIWVLLREVEGLVAWPYNPDMDNEKPTEYVPASRLSALAERVERATELLKDAQVAVIGMAALLWGMPLEAKTVTLAERISSFLHDGTKGEGK